jgi:hypothetical protein
MFRWIHRRAVLAFLVLPWLTLVIAVGGCVLLDGLLGDALILQDWVQAPRREFLAAWLRDLPWLLGAMYALGALPWLLGVLLGGRPPVRTALVVAALCGGAGYALLAQTSVSPWHPAVWLIVATLASSGALYALLTHRIAPRVGRRMPRRVVAPPPPAPAPPPPPPRPAPPPPPMTRHDAPTTLPTEIN